MLHSSNRCRCLPKHLHIGKAKCYFLLDSHVRVRHSKCTSWLCSKHMSIHHIISSQHCKLASSAISYKWPLCVLNLTKLSEREVVPLQWMQSTFSHSHLHIHTKWGGCSSVSKLLPSPCILQSLLYCITRTQQAATAQPERNSKGKEKHIGSVNCFCKQVDPWCISVCYTIQLSPFSSTNPGKARV